MWINHKNGEYWPDAGDPDVSPHPDAEWVDSMVLPEEQVGIVEFDDEGLPNWYVKQEGADDLELASAKAWLEKIKRNVSARRNYRKKHYWKRVEKRAMRDIAAQRGDKKSINYPLGRCGTTKSRAKVEVVEEEAALAFLFDRGHYAAIKTVRTVIKDALPACDVPGVVRHPGGEDVFYARGAKP